LRLVVKKKSANERKKSQLSVAMALGMSVPLIKLAGSLLLTFSRDVEAGLEVGWIIRD